LAAFCSSSSVVAGIDFDLTAHTWDSVTGRVLTTTKNVGPNPAGRLLSPDCSRLATWSSSGTDADVNFEVWDMTAGKKLFDLGKAHRIVNTNFSADGDHILAAEDDGSIRVWLARNGKLLIEHNVGTGQFSQATFSPHGDLVITWSGASPEVLDLESQKKLALQGHGGIVTAAAFSFDSSLVATASEDSTVRVWSAANGKELARLKAADKVYNLEFSTDCHRLLAAGVQFVAIYRIVTADGSDFSVQ